MIKTTLMKIFVLIFILLLLMSCDRHFYNGNVAVEAHPWVLIKIDTFYFQGRYKPSATWYNKHDRLDYVYNSHDFPYPFDVGDKIFNFDRR